MPEIFEPEIASYGAPESEPAPDVFGYDEAGATYPSDIVPEISYSRDVEVPPAPDVIKVDQGGSAFDWSSMFKTIARPIGTALGTSIGQAAAGTPAYSVNAAAAGSGPAGLPNRNPFVIPSFLRFGSGTSSAVSTTNPTNIVWLVVVVVVGFILFRAIAR